MARDPDVHDISDNELDGTFAIFKRYTPEYTNPSLIQFCSEFDVVIDFSAALNKMIDFLTKSLSDQIKPVLTPFDYYYNIADPYGVGNLYPSKL